MQRGIGRNIAANVVTSAAMLGAAVLSVPLILGELGLEAYGVWTIALTIVVYVTIADAGVGPVVQRFAAVARGAGDAAAIGRVFWTAVAVYLTVGLLVVAGAYLAAPTLVNLFDVPGDLEGDAETLFRFIGPIALVGLVQSTLGNLQQGLERFVAFGVSTALGAAVNLVAIAVLLWSGAGLVGLAWAAVAQQVTMLLVRGWSVRDVLAAARPALARPGERRELLTFSAKLQVSVLSWIVNSQTDKIIVGLVASPRTVGLVGIGAQIAEAGRLVAGAALSPLTSRLSIAFGAQGEPGVMRLFPRLHRLWLLGAGGATAIGVFALYPLIAGWLGPGHADAALYGGFLVLGYGINVSTGSGTAYVKAVGRPGLDARYNGLTIALNAALTIPLGIAYGAIGVVAATAGAYALATAWFFTRLPAQLAGPGGPPPGVLARAAGLALLAGAAACACGLLAITLLPPGASFVVAGAAIAAAFVAYMSAATGVRPTVRNVRLLFA
jgi:O-antigen/teichoic acid export membrane protein